MLFFDLALVGLFAKPSLLFHINERRPADNGCLARRFVKPPLVFLPPLFGYCLASVAQRLTHVGG